MENILIVIGIALVLAVLIFVIVWVSMLNKLTQLSAQVNLTIGTLAAQFEQRMNLIPDTLRAAREAVQAQRSYLDRMLEVRRGMHPGVIPADLGALPPDYAPLAAATAAAVVGKPAIENNPAMNVEAYTQLQRIMHDTEKDVTAARRFYWAAVAEYNTGVRSFPSCIVAAIHRYRDLPDAAIAPGLDVKPNYF